MDNNNNIETLPPMLDSVNLSGIGGTTMDSGSSKSVDLKKRQLKDKKDKKKKLKGKKGKKEKKDKKKLKVKNLDWKKEIKAVLKEYPEGSIVPMKQVRSKVLSAQAAKIDKVLGKQFNKKILKDNDRFSLTQQGDIQILPKKVEPIGSPAV